MTTSPYGRKLIESFEGCRLESYQDVAGVWTIGYGHTQAVKSGDTCTQEDASDWLDYDLGWVNDCINRYCQVSLNQNQVDALSSFIFNLGCGAFRSSTLLKLINAGACAQAALQFVRWDMADGKPSDGLLKRRQAEAALFVTPVATT